MEKAKQEKSNNKYSHHLLDVDGKCLLLRIDMNVGFSDACEIVAIFDPSKKSYAEKMIKDLDKE